jgi:hypothetical protein
MYTHTHTHTHTHTNTNTHANTHTHAHTSHPPPFTTIIIIYFLSAHAFTNSKFNMPFHPPCPPLPFCPHLTPLCLVNGITSFSLDAQCTFAALVTSL